MPLRDAARSPRARPTKPSSAQFEAKVKARAAALAREAEAAARVQIGARRPVGGEGGVEGLGGPAVLPVVYCIDCRQRVDLSKCSSNPPQTPPEEEVDPVTGTKRRRQGPQMAAAEVEEI
jgi:hypothetical protein